MTKIFKMWQKGLDSWDGFHIYYVMMMRSWRLESSDGFQILMSWCCDFCLLVALISHLSCTNMPSTWPSPAAMTRAAEAPITLMSWWCDLYLLVALISSPLSCTNMPSPWASPAAMTRAAEAPITRSASPTIRFSSHHFGCCDHRYTSHRYIVCATKVHSVPDFIAA